MCAKLHNWKTVVSHSLTFLSVPLINNPLLLPSLPRQSLKEGSLIAIFNLTKFV